MGFYIIEINDKYKQVVLLSADGELYCKDVSGLMPYTEPDLDAIRNEAYEKGAQDTKKHWADFPRTCAYKLGYENGLNDAWEAARKIALDKEDGGLDTVAYCEIFGYGKGYGAVLKTFTASEAIEKIRAYEQTKEDKNFDEVKDVLEETVKVCNVTLDEIATVLQKMKGEEG